MSDVKLKPCPFCGAPHPYITFERGYIDDSAIVFCNACKISVKLEENDQEGFNYETERKAVEAWNRRAEPVTSPLLTEKRKRQHMRGNSMSNLIYRDAAIDVLRAKQTYKVFEGDDMLLIDQAEAMTELMMLPSAEAERKKGEWIDHQDEGYVECPFCHSATNCDGNKEELHFCFSCGADMRGEQNEND